MTSRKIYGQQTSVTAVYALKCQNNNKKKKIRGNSNEHGRKVVIKGDIIANNDINVVKSNIVKM